MFGSERSRDAAGIAAYDGIRLKAEAHDAYAHEHFILHQSAIRGSVISRVFRGVRFLFRFFRLASATHRFT